MNILALGINLWQDNSELLAYQSDCGHSVRTLGMRGEPNVDFHFDPEETATQVVERISREWPVDLLLCGCPELYPPPCELEHCPVRTVAMISDWNLYQPQLEHNLARFDLVISDKPGTVRLCLVGAEPRYWGPIYSHRPQVHRDLGLHRDIDVGFYGNLNPAAHPRRIVHIQQIATLSDSYRVECSGHHTQEDYATLLNRTRIAFNGSIRGEMNLRCFEAPACGALLFIERDNTEVGEVFTDGETAVFYTDDNLLEKIQHYLNHETERERIAKAGQALIHEWRATNRLDGLFDWMAQQPTSGRRFHTFDQPTCLRANAMLYSSALPELQQPLAADALAQWLDACPDDPAALLANGCFAFDTAMRGNTTSSSAEIQRAGLYFERATRAAPAEAIAWHNLGVLLTIIRKPEAARQSFENARSRTAEQCLGAFVLGKNSNPHYVRLRWNLAEGEEITRSLHDLVESHCEA